MNIISYEMANFKIYGSEQTLYEWRHVDRESRDKLWFGQLWRREPEKKMEMIETLNHLVNINLQLLKLSETSQLLVSLH